MPNDPIQTTTYRVRRDNHGYAQAIERDGYTVLILSTGAARNEEEVEQIVRVMNRGDVSNVRSA